MSTSTTESVHLQQVRDYRFDVRFGTALPLLQVDEPEPLGRGEGPTPVQLLAAAVGNCLSASLLFALRKYREAPDPIGCEVLARVGRNEQGRLRVLALEASLRLGVAARELPHLEQVLDRFESFCTVSQSIAAAVPVSVSIFDPSGQRLR